ncbi:hypothetical protein WH52_14590 [Tenacibaculum holothuriorum]|uniref:Metallo-beta-lactamase domain-containing protein n=1 Tax=Tenacibaculum holothuriorum TaxID=1635173 RepID=A0A1Y2P8S1_9FLAO|nr:MBL fold metallo-hydrolase [Tenacibaculum holothuriorum]OSY86823.1 hypothetical protein WH52_14590 [Tenacibaculum holothuriorum]
MQIERVTSHWTTNTYYIEHNGESVLIDASDLAIKEYVKITPKQIIVTHGHVDHIEVLEDLKEEYSCEVTIQKDGQLMLTDPMMNTSGFFPQFKTISCKEAENTFKGKEFEFTIGGKLFKTMHTPGHSPDSSVFYNEEEKLLIAGDLIFENSIGRSDFMHSNTEEHLKNVVKVLDFFDDDYTVLPGHGNPFLLGKAKNDILSVVQWVANQERIVL